MAKAKKRKTKKASRAAKARKAPMKKAKARTAKRKAGAKKTGKKPARTAKKATVRKVAAKKPARKTAKRKTVGEGDYQASRTFLKDQANFVKKHRAEIPAMGKQAEMALEGPEGADLKAAEAEAASHSHAAE